MSGISPNSDRAQLQATGNLGSSVTAATSNAPAAADIGSWLALVALAPSWLSFAWLVLKAQWFWTHQPDLQFGWIVLALCGYLFYEAWENRPSPECRWTWGRATAIGLGLALFFLVQIYQAAFGTQPASVFGLATAALLIILGNLGYVFGRTGVRHFLFPFAFLFVALPLPSIVHNIVVGGLQSKIAGLNVETLNLCGIPAARMGSVIRLPHCTVGVDEACSGIRSLQSTVMATLFIARITLRRFPLKVLLLVAGIFLAVTGNFLRSLFLSYTAYTGGLRALESVHDTAGWSILLLTAAGVAALAFGMSKLEKRACPKPIPEAPKLRRV